MDRPVTSSTNLFAPIKVGTMHLQHRVVQAPLTRFRASQAHVHGDLAVQYYGQRASTPGTMIITEGTFIAPEAGGYDNVPGIWNDEQMAAWKRVGLVFWLALLYLCSSIELHGPRMKQVTDAVHSHGSFIVVQLWALGRGAKQDVLEREGYKVVAPSDIPGAEGSVPQPLTRDEIAGYVQKYAKAARNAMDAGFDG